MDDLFRTDVLHDRDVHLLFKGVGDVGFGVGELLTHLGDRKIIFKMLLDIMNDLGDDRGVIRIVDSFFIII